LVAEPGVDVETEEFVIARTRAWVDRVVIGLNLCPFAKGPQGKGLVRYTVCPAVDAEGLLASLLEELRWLADTPSTSVETTLLIHPYVLSDFANYNDFLDTADAALQDLALDGIIQVASFHPHYQFAGSAPADLSNATNRSPYPMLHLIREESIDRAVAAFPEAEAIFENNIATAEQLGPSGWAALLEQCEDDALRQKEK
jgi:uncharacterized protein